MDCHAVEARKRAQSGEHARQANEMSITTVGLENPWAAFLTRLCRKVFGGCLADRPKLRAALAVFEPDAMGFGIEPRPGSARISFRRQPVSNRARMAAIPVRFLPWRPTFRIATPRARNSSALRKRRSLLSAKRRTPRAAFSATVPCRLANSRIAPNMPTVRAATPRPPVALPETPLFLARLCRLASGHFRLKPLDIASR